MGTGALAWSGPSNVKVDRAWSTFELKVKEIGTSPLLTTESAFGVEDTRTAWAHMEPAPTIEIKLIKHNCETRRRNEIPVEKANIFVLKRKPESFALF
jgi:hypothetical protein